MTKFLTAKRKPPVISPVIDLLAHPEYRPEWEKLQTLNLERDRLNAEISSIEAVRARRVSARESFRATAKALLDGTLPPSAIPSLEELGNLHKRRTLLEDEKDGMIKQQSDRLATIRERISRDLCASLRPVYAEIVQRMAGILIELAAVLEQEKAFRDALEAAGIFFSAAIHPMVPLAMTSAEKVGKLDDPFSNVARWFGEAREHGYI